MVRGSHVLFLFLFADRRFWGNEEPEVGWAHRVACRGGEITGYSIPDNREFLFLPFSKRNHLQEPKTTASAVLRINVFISLIGDAD